FSAKRLLPVVRAAGYTGSARNLRRAVAKIKTEHRQKRRLYRPWVPTPGQHLVIDWTPEAGMHIFCAVLAWSRYRFVRFARNETRETTLARQPAFPASSSQERSLDGLVADFLDDLAHANRSAHTQRAYAGDLARFVRFHPGPASAITTEVLRSFFATIAHLTPAPRARKEAALASF